VTADRFTGKTAIVTGAGGQIGRACALRLAREGARVLAVDVDADAAGRTAEEITANRGEALAFAADVTDPESVEGYATRAAEYGGGHVDLLFNNAGIEGPVAPVADYPVQAFDRVLAVNVRGVFLGMRQVIPRLAPGAAIVNTSSTAGLGGVPGMLAYVASKHAVLGMTRTAARELAPSSIRVNAVCPGPVDSRMMRSLEQGTGLPNAQELFTATIPFGRYGQVDEVAGVVTFLLSADAGYVTGAAYEVDGGQTSG
jgi:3alpha(or 20beta)-hydroxysteroid dehydrogenase